MRNQKPVAAVIAAGVLWGVISIFINRLSAAGLDSLQISLVRMAVSALAFTVTAAVTDVKKLKIRLRDIWMFIGTGIVSVVLFNVCYFYTIVHSEASVAVVLLYTSPIFILLISAFLFHERITPKKVAALAMTFGGCVLVAGVLGGGVSLTPFVFMTGLGSGLFYALYTIFGRFALARYDTVTVTAYTFIFGFLGSLPLGKAGRVAAILRQDPELIIWCLGLGIICAVLPYFLYTWGLQRMESGKAAILVAVEPLVGAVVGMTVYHESHSPLKLCGIVLILGAIILLNLNDKPAEAALQREK